MEYADKQKQFGDCCVCESAVERKRRTLILGPTQPARSVMKSLQFFLKEERNEDIDDTRLKSLSEKDHICHSCKNRIIKYAEYTNKRREIVEFLDRHIPRRKSVKLEVTPISPHTRPASTTEQPRSTALSMYPNDHDPPPAPTDVPHSQSGYGELSEADMMRNSSLVTNMVQAAGGHHAHTGCPPPLQNANSGRAQIPTGGPGSIPGGHEPQPVVNPANTASPILNGVPGAARSGQSRLLQPAAQVADLQEGDSTLSSQDDGHDLRKELLNNAGRSPCATLLPSTTVTTSQLPPLTKMVDTGPEPTSVPLVSAATHTLCLCRVTAVKCLLELLALECVWSEGDVLVCVLRCYAPSPGCQGIRHPQGGGRCNSTGPDAGSGTGHATILPGQSTAPPQWRHGWMHSCRDGRHQAGCPGGPHPCTARCKLCPQWIALPWRCHRRSGEWAGQATAARSPAGLPAGGRGQRWPCPIFPG